MNNEFNFHELKAADRLPSPSGTALAIMQLVQRENSTAQQVAHLVQSDPALSGRVLRFVNSAAFGVGRSIASVQEAVLMMGMQAVRNFALSLSLIGIQHNSRCQGFDYALYWSDSLLLAVAIASITARERTVAPEEAFTLGLLADIGRLALATAWPETYGECCNPAQADRILAMEQERFAIDHETLSLMLLADWGLPGIFLDALKHSLDSEIRELSRAARFARQLAFARHIVHYCLANEANQAVLWPTLETEASQHALDKTALLKLTDEIIMNWHDWGKLIGLKTAIRHDLPEKPIATKETLPGLNLLLVDDDAMMLARLSKQLAAAGHSVQVCRNGELALKYVIEHNPHLVITDWRMKPTDGIQLCKILRASNFGKNIYFIMLTATESEDALVEAFDAGIDDYVTKPVSLRVLLARVQAGQRIIMLQQELEKERRNIERYSAELSVANRRLEHMANTDLLTDLPNRRHAMSRLQEEWTMAQKFQRPLSILMLDLDYFKSVNDTLGHNIGDKVLAHTANIIRETLRVNDLPCRLGGEEFLVIAPNTDTAAALQLAERIRRGIEKNQLVKIAFTRPVTISIGVATSTAAKPDWEDLINLADQALYRVKRGNRNGVQLAQQ
ncbi:Response regulator receiver modulated diguanylate cyclase [Candidatus Methylobacter favarea]|uniref:diguanylate cyclase n=1 Tax=Candidatus Methylobacter favarea TaxID=2707345 RepID=A0A8S0Y5M9_9GAMM|nr:diguanylate cyclase [Candidatus Methylobacter favarea]CAA9889408.1 Response regulator receiver modulated diguanylate cyclase [Candidatus Methylobacter favarea]